MTSKHSEPTEAYVWVWLPGSQEPVVAGLLELSPGGLPVTFTYAASYRARPDAISLYQPELPVTPGRIAPFNGRLASCLRDASPDTWGRRVIVRRWGDEAVDDLGELTYMLESGSDRIGALDFQASPTVYVPRDHDNASLAELEEAAHALDAGEAMPSTLVDALVHGTSVGGARPKALITDASRRFIAKFSSSTDPFPIVKAEFVAMTLARRAGLDVTPVEITQIHGRDVLLVERFDRRGGERRLMVSALTILQLDELDAALASSYADLAVAVRAGFHDPVATLAELFGRITFNILCSNTDDHARNHSAFWDGRLLRLTPAYDVCPQPRSGGETRQAMAIGADGWRYSQLAGCIDRAGVYLSGRNAKAEARAIVDRQVEAIRSGWDDVCDQAGLTQQERDDLSGRQFLNPYAFYGY